MPRIVSIIILACFLFTTSALPVSAATSYAYDQNGNMTQSGTRCFDYNEANQMHRVKNCADNKTIAEYIYDHSGKRLVKKEYENGVLKQTIYSPTDEYETKKIEGGATENTVYYKANSEVIAKKNPDGTINYYHNDHLGSTTDLTDQTGNMIEKSAYEPYGEVKQGGTKSKYGYTGQEKDSETGLNYYDARYYDPHIQRFIQPDTLLPDIYDPQQLNRYAYARNNPLKYTDPTGHFSIISALSIAWKAIASPIGKAIAKAATSLPIIGPALNYVAKNPTVQQVTQKTQAVTNNPTVKAVLGHVDGVESGVKDIKQTINTINQIGQNAKVSSGTIYRAINQTPTYVGKTIDFFRREGEWAKKGRVIEPIKGLENIPIEHLSGVEQAAIEKYGIQNLSNVRNAVSPNNPIYQRAIDIGKKYLEDADL